MQRPAGGEMNIGNGAPPEKPAAAPDRARARASQGGPSQSRGRALMPFVPFAGLAALAPFTDEEKNYVSGLLGRIEHFRPGVQLVSEGAPLDHPRFVIAGWACRARTLSDGRR